MAIRSKFRWLVSRQNASATTAESERIVIEGTGDAVQTDGGTANTGYSGPPLKQGQNITVRGTGSATATGCGQANTGISFT